MAIVPKRKTSKQRKHKRNSHVALVPKTLRACKNCGEKSLPHRICKLCGYYKGKEIIKVKTTK